MIRFEGLQKTYGDVAAVGGLDFAVEAGCVFGFLGRNGAGKTTTIRMMMGLLEPSAGTVRLGGHDIRTAPEAAKSLAGYLPDRPYLYEKLTGLELLRFVGGLHGLGRAEAAARGAALLAAFRLESRGGALIETYSHGMKQRLALAAALIHRPRILILDEPMVGLDPEGAVELRTLLRRLAADGVTIFLSTHSLPVAEELCHRIGIIDRGRLVALGTLAELRARAASGERVTVDGQHPSLERVFLDILEADAA
ncbi:MAG TPA: ABC transporter ATP-binding protein [Candidatus Limnocylindria bacterium]|nr:ABC transporter ATP-binding protein [Candidatus Limnocylindria bacterium]